MVESLKALQDVLGRHQDREVQVDAAAVAGRRGGDAAARARSALMAMGVLVDRLQADEAAARAEFAERFAALADEQRQLVKSRSAATTRFRRPSCLTPIAHPRSP